MRTLALLMTAMFLVVPASAQVGIENPDTPTPVTLYFHLDAHQDFPINTQQPDDRYAASDSLGILAASTSCVPDGGGAGNQASKQFHTYYGFSTPGYVEYDFQEINGPRIHPERGLAADVLFDTSSPATMYWYLTTEPTGNDPRFGGEQTSTLPVIIPQVTVKTTIRTGDDVSIGAVAYNSGDIVAEGASEPMLVYPDANNPSYIAAEDGTHIYEFQVPLQFNQDMIPKDEAYNVRVDIMMDVPGCNEDNDDYLMTSNVQVHTSPDLRPRLEWSIRNPVAIEFIHPQIIDDRLLIHTALSSPWGNYDVDESQEGITVSIDGPTEARSLVRTAFVQRHHEHGHHFEPVDVTYVWPFKLDQAERAEYTIEVRAKNDQGTGEAIGRVAVDLSRNVAIDSDGNEVTPAAGEGSEATPGVGPVALIAALGAAAVALKRRD